MPEGRGVSGQNSVGGQNSPMEVGNKKEDLPGSDQKLPLARN